MPQQANPHWEEQPDGSRVRIIDGIRIVDRTRSEPAQPQIEHLVAQPEDGGRLVIIGLDARCRPVYLTTLYGYL